MRRKMLRSFRCDRQTSRYADRQTGRQSEIDRQAERGRQIDRQTWERTRVCLCKCVYVRVSSKAETEEEERRFFSENTTIPAEARTRPWGAQDRQRTQPVWPLSVLCGVSVLRHHRRTVMSPLPEASRELSGLKATHKTASVCPGKNRKKANSRHGARPRHPRETADNETRTPAGFLIDPYRSLYPCVYLRVSVYMSPQT